MAVSKVENHRHPMNEDAWIEGVRLAPGEVLQEGDVYDSTVGKWEKCPCPGGTVPDSKVVIWVRPWRQLSDAEKKHLFL